MGAQQPSADYLRSLHGSSTVRKVSSTSSEENKLNRVIDRLRPEFEKWFSKHLEPKLKKAADSARQLYTAWDFKKGRTKEEAKAWERLFRDKLSALDLQVDIRKSRKEIKISWYRAGERPL